VPTQGLGFAIPGELVRDKVAEFKRAAAKAKAAPKVAASLARKSFGLQLQDFTPELSETFGYEPDAGVLIADVDPGSPAAEIGMQRGHAIYQLGRHTVTSVRQIEELLAVVTTGSRVDFTVGVIRRVRGQAVRQLQTVTLTAR
jgi:serine protease Do